MSIMNGMEAARQILQLPNLAKVPIIAVTGNAFAEGRARCIDAGMSDFITKPFKPDVLFSTLLKWLTHARQQRADG